MKATNRDLLVLVKDQSLNAASMEEELDRINKMLIKYETLSTLCGAHEVFDLNRYKKLKKQFEKEAVIRSQQQTAFVFVININ